jgi:hypothetical protein
VHRDRLFCEEPAELKIIGTQYSQFHPQFSISEVVFAANNGLTEYRASVLFHGIHISFVS